RESGERLHAVEIKRGLAHRAAENDELLIPLGEIDSDLGRRHRILGVSDDCRPLEQGREVIDVRAFESFFREAVLGDFYDGPTLLHLPAKRRHLRDGETGVMSDHDRLGALEGAVERCDLLLLLRSVHFLSPVGEPGITRIAGCTFAARLPPQGQKRARRLSPVPSTSPERASQGALVRTDFELSLETGWSPSMRAPFGIKFTRVNTSSLGQVAEEVFVLRLRRPGSLPDGIL